MKIRVQVLKNLLDHTQKVYMLVGTDSRIIDGKEYVPVLVDLNRPRISWVSKDAYELKKNIIEVSINV